MVVVVVATICALAWMCYRVSALLNIPIPTLVKILGLDLPAPPRVSLHGVSADTITLHWSLPEKAGSVAKHIIQINGINVGESEKRGETSVTVTGLNPDQRYNVRVIAANSQNFQAPGQLIRLRTCAKPRVADSNSGVQKTDSSDDAPSVHSTLDVPPSPQHTQNSNHNHGQHSSRRSARERRNSPANPEQSQNLQNHSSSTQDDQQTVDSLTRDLDVVRKEVVEAETQLVHMEEEYKAAEAVLRAELDTLREKKKEEDVDRARIRAETKTLEESRRTAEAARTRTEKALRAKEYDIKKIQDDITRWEEEKMSALDKVEELSNAAQESKENAVTTEKELSNDIQETQRQISDMEEEIRSLVAAMKNLETQKEQLKIEEDEEARKCREDAEQERLWRDRQRNLEMRYVTVYNGFQAAEIEFIRSREALMGFQARRGSGSGADALQKKPKQRRNRNRKSRTHTASSSMNAYPLHESGFQDGSAFNPMQFQQISPTFSNSVPSSPFFNIANGTVTGPPEMNNSEAGPIMDPYMDPENDNYLSGIPMSPTANALLPSNLFAFEDSPPSPKAATPIDDFPSRSMPFDNSFMAPQSPLSSDSVSTSPRSSFNHIPLYSNFNSTQHPESGSTTMSPIGSDRPGVNSDVDSPAPKSSGSKRLVHLLSNSFSRQRGKTVGFDEGPPELVQSHTFPKNDSPGLDPIGTRRRSGSHGSWTNSLDFLRKPLERTPSERSAQFKQFNPNFDPIDPVKLFDQRPISPRPSSIASFDNPLPVPSSDASAAFGWPATSGGNTGKGGNRWADFRTGRISHSRPVSRPISPTGNASTSSPSLFPTYFSSPNSGRPTTPRLNPAAPTFQSRMNTPARTSEAEPAHEYQSPHRGADTISISTTLSAVSGASLESVHTKESILSRFSALSRKGSTGKFNISSWGKKKADEEIPTSHPASASKDKGEKEKGGLWSSWVKDDKEEESGALTPLAKESSPWMKSSQNGFFGTIGRTRKDTNASEDDAEKREDKKMKEKDDSGEKKGLGIFSRKKTEKVEEEQNEA